MDELILICEDNPDIQALLEFNLRQEEFLTHCLSRGDEVVDVVKRVHPALVLLDLMLPGANGLEICKKLRADPTTQKIPIVMVTARTGEGDRLQGLEAGADDYICKPFSPKEVCARVRAVLRRAAPAFTPEAPIKGSRIEINPAAHRVYIDGTEIQLTISEYKILKELLAHNGKVIPRKVLLGSVSGSGEIRSRTLDVHVVSLRKKMGEAGALIETVRGVGYRLDDA